MRCPRVLLAIASLEVFAPPLVGSRFLRCARQKIGPEFVGDTDALRSPLGLPWVP
jgi:hypothetical protein